MVGTNEVLAYVILFIGVGLLVFTFLSACIFLAGFATFDPVPSLVENFGEVLAPLIETCIRIIYLGIMGWIGSILTVRGMQATVRPKDRTPVDSYKIASLERSMHTTIEKKTAKSKKTTHKKTEKGKTTTKKTKRKKKSS